MSYVEHGARIFITGINTGPQVDQGDGFGRLKMIESCSDIRAWSTNPVENFRYFREIIEQANPTAIIMPNIDLDEMIENHKEEDETEKLKRELAKYKALNLTPEQKKKLELDYHDMLNKEDSNVVDVIFHHFLKLIGYKNASLNKSTPTFTEITNKNKDNKLKLYEAEDITNNPNEIVNYKKSNLKEVKSSTSISFSLSNESFDDKNIPNETNNVKFYPEKESSTSSSSNSTNYQDNDNDNDDNNSNDESQLSDTLSESERSHKITVESMIIALKENLQMKDTEIDELKEENIQLKQYLNDRDCQINNLKIDFQEKQNQFEDLLAKNDKELSEWKNDVFNGKKIINQLRKSLEEKNEECDNQSQQLNNLKRDSIDVASIKSERDSLAITCDEISKFLKSAGYYEDDLGQGLKRIFCEYSRLVTLKKNLELSCSEKEDELAQSYEFIKQLQEENKNQMQEINRIREDVEKKTNLIDNYEEKIASLTKQCLEKSEIEKSFYENELINGDCDQAFSKYFKQSLDNLHELTDALKDAGDDVEKRKKEIKKLKKQMDEHIQIFKEQLSKKSKEGRYYRFRYKECQKVINEQIEEIEKLKQVIDKLEKKLIYKMELSVSELHQEHNNLTTEIQNLTSCIYERNIKIVELESEKENLINRIDYTSAQLDEKNVKIEALKEENSKVIEKIDSSKKTIEDISNALQSIQFQIEKIYQVSLLDKKVTLEEKNKKKLENSIIESDDDNYQNSDENLKDNMMDMLNQTENLECKIFSIKNGIDFISNELNIDINSKKNSVSLFSDLKKELNDSDCSNEKKIIINEKINSQRIESNEEIKNTNHAIKLSKQKNKDLNLNLNGKRMIHQNSLIKKSQYLGEIIKSYCENNNISKGLETPSLDDESGFLSETSAFSTRLKNIGKSNSENDDNFVFIQDNDNNEKLNERSIDEESENSTSPTCKQFILHCSKHLNSEKYG